MHLYMNKASNASTSICIKRRIRGSPNYTSGNLSPKPYQWEFFHQSEDFFMPCVLWCRIRFPIAKLQEVGRLVMITSYSIAKDNQHQHRQQTPKMITTTHREQTYAVNDDTSRTNICSCIKYNYFNKLSALVSLKYDAIK